MRTCGETVGGGGFGAHDHVCWAFDGVDDLLPAVTAFLAEGLNSGFRVEFIAAGPAAGLRRQLAGLGDVDALVASGALRVTSLTAAYGAAAGAEADPSAQVDAYMAATREAIVDGFAGYRAAADVTSLLAADVAPGTFARYEHAIDRAMLGEPFSALCCYDRTVLGADVVGRMASLHPVSRAGASPFAVFHGADGLAVRGELDTFDTALLAQTLATSMPLTEGEFVEVDAAGVRFVDHQALLTLEAHGRAANATILLRNAGASFARLSDLMDLQAVRIGGQS